jgi:hypothetical protein
MVRQNPIYFEIRLRERCATTRRRHEDVDRLLGDQFDPHLSVLRTGMSSRSFTLRAVRIGDGDRRLAGLLRSVQALAAAQPAIPASPYPMRGTFWIRDNTSRTTSNAGTATLR